MKLLEKELGYRFKNKRLLENALTHSSYANDKCTLSNERLEFLGDSILNFTVAEELYKQILDAEGKLSKVRASLVSTKNLAACIDNTNIFSYIKLGASFSNMKNTDFTSIKADLFEAIIGAMYLDGGLKEAKKFIIKKINLRELLKNEDSLDKDYKSILQEWAQEKHKVLEYRMLELSTNPTEFRAEVLVDKKLISSATGKSKKEAQILAAKQTIKKLRSKK